MKKLIQLILISICIVFNHTARALTISGAFSIGIPPFLLHAQMYMRSLGVHPYSSSYFFNK